jgi:hypothetical protein
MCLKFEMKLLYFVPVIGACYPFFMGQWLRVFGLALCGAYIVAHAAFAFIVTVIFVRPGKDYRLFPSRDLLF